jgi:hypothetical protein
MLFEEFDKKQLVVSGQARLADVEVSQGGDVAKSGCGVAHENKWIAQALVFLPYCRVAQAKLPKRC